MKTGRLKLTNDCVAEELGDEVILLHIITGQYHSLNEFGSLILKQIEDYQPTFDELLQALKSRFTGADIEADTRKFIDKMIERKIFEIEQ